MNKAFVAVGLGLALSGVAFAQQKSAKEQIVGAWTLVSVTVCRQNISDLGLAI
jgi:hypothetical protein